MVVLQRRIEHHADDVARRNVVGRSGIEGALCSRERDVRRLGCREARAGERCAKQQCERAGIDLRMAWVPVWTSARGLLMSLRE